MFFVCSLLVMVICTVTVLQELRNFEHRLGKCAFFAAYGLIFGLAPMMQSDNSYVHSFGEPARIQAAMYSLAGLLMLLAGFSLGDWPVRRLAAKKRELRERLARPHNQRFLKLVFWFSIAIAASAQLLMMHAKGISLSDVIHGGRFEHRLYNRGVLSVLSIHLTSFCYVPVFVGMFLNMRYRIITLVYLVLASLVFFLVFSKGTRSIPIAMMVTLLVAASIRFRFPIQRIALVGVVGVVALFLAIGMSELRQHQNEVSFLEGLTILFTSAAYSDMWDGDPLGYSSNLVGAVATFPEHHPYLDGATYRRMPVFFLKETQFPDLKPPDTNILFGLVVHGRPEELQVTVPPTILGDVYINFWGWRGLPLLALHGMLYAWMLRSMQCSLFHFCWIGPLSGRFLVLVHRGEPYEMFFLFIMFFLLMSAVFAICRKISLSNREAACEYQHRARKLPRPQPQPA